jgi:N-glycosylase/DNA lyase
MKTTLFIEVPKDFSFRATVYSHGWCELAPFELDEENWRLSYVFRDAKNKAVPAVISEEKRRIRIELSNSNADAAKVIADTRHLLRLDDDLNGFYNAINGQESLQWVSEKRAGRLLRSATVFEDLVKTICTTNCSWGLTKSMVTNLVEKLGSISSPPARGGVADASSDEVVGGGGKKAFPTAEAMASVNDDFYRNEIRAGYRSPYFVELAEAVASGKLDPQSWLTSELPTPELKKEMKKVKGVGDYAAENLLKLVGRYDGLALDSWLRSQFYKNHNNAKTCPDKKIERHYKKFGPWRGLVIWCDMTEKWIN